MRDFTEVHSGGRRKFIQTSGLALAGLALLPSCSPSSPGRRYGLQLYTLREQLSADLEGTLKAVAKIGYKDLEIFGYADGKVFGVTPSELRKMVEDLGMKLVSGHYLTGNINAPWQGTLSAGWEKAVEDANTMGLKYMVNAFLFPEERQSIDDYKKLTDLLNVSAKVAKNAGIQFGYHNHDFEFLELEGQLPMYVIMDGTDDDLVVAELDLYWATRAGHSPMHFFKRYPKRTALWHVKDMADSDDKEFTEVGNGVIDFKAIFEKSMLSGMKYFFVEQDVCQRPPVESIAISYKNLMKWGI
ncbi:MAG: sugar phosphate isomerase/epimerase family protein [Imperialibacter sp.]|uniref:sugar phosphate isomerase/epimerase family protein n=1 Tax=Imperialibacter sp. TaxID=2038411 RepID=UPI003A8C2E3F